jgi:hypothetical protein
MSSKKWDNIYIAVDLHGVIVKPTYMTHEDVFDFYPGAIEALNVLSKIPEVKLILFTGSYRDVIENVLSALIDRHVYFDYVNENPEVENTYYLNTRCKLYYDVLFDDKAGFQPEADWPQVQKMFQSKFLSLTYGKTSTTENIPNGLHKPESRGYCILSC